MVMTLTVKWKMGKKSLSPIASSREHMVCLLFTYITWVLSWIYWFSFLLLIFLSLLLFLPPFHHLSLSPSLLLSLFHTSSLPSFLPSFPSSFILSVHPTFLCSSFSFSVLVIHFTNPWTKILLITTQVNYAFFSINHFVSELLEGTWISILIIIIFNFSKKIIL